MIGQAETPPTGEGRRGDAIFVVSDLHMSLGRDVTGGWDRHEAFRDDARLARFLAYLSERARQLGGRTRLLLLGDVFDFVHAGVARGVDTSAVGGVERLRRIAAGHQAVFAALGRLAADGVPITIVPGNHDLELLRPAVRDELRRLLVEAGAPSEVSRLVVFEPWIFLVPGLVYAEHGSQHHDVNAVPELLACASNSAPIEPPLGSDLTRYLLRLGDATGAGGPAPRAGPLARTLAARPELAFRTLPLHAAFLGALVRHPLRLARAAWRRSAYRSSALDRYARSLGLSYETLVAIDALSPVSPRALPVRAARLAARHVLRARETALAGESTPSSLSRAARSIHGALEAERQDVPFYVFGHSHRPEDVALVSERPGPRYLNGGTWSSLVPRDLDDASRFGFVEILAPQSHEEAPTARVLRWNDGQRAAEPLRVSSPRPLESD